MAQVGVACCRAAPARLRAQVFYHLLLHHLLLLTQVLLCLASILLGSLQGTQRRIVSAEGQPDGRQEKKLP